MSCIHYFPIKRKKLFGRPDKYREQYRAPDIFVYIFVYSARVCVYKSPTNAENPTL